MSFKLNICCLLIRLYYQDFIGLMSEQNPSGGIPDSSPYKKCVIFAMSVAFIVAVKRVWLGLKLGRVTFCKYEQILLYTDFFLF